MTYATELVQRYRLALHTLWNLHFWAPEPFRDEHAATQFERVKLPLFLSLVEDRLGSDLPAPTRIFGDAFQLVPPLNTQRSGIPSLLVERRPSSGFWELVNGPFEANRIRLVLLDFFDWELQSWRDFRYYLARIEAFPDDPSLAGSRALVEVPHADVLWEPPGILGMPAPQHR